MQTKTMEQISESLKLKEGSKNVQNSSLFPLQKCCIKCFQIHRKIQNLAKTSLHLFYFFFYCYFDNISWYNSVM